MKPHEEMELRGRLMVDDSRLNIFSEKNSVTMARIWALVDSLREELQTAETLRGYHDKRAEQAIRWWREQRTRAETAEAKLARYVEWSAGLEDAITDALVDDMGWTEGGVEEFLKRTGCLARAEG